MIQKLLLALLPFLAVSCGKPRPPEGRVETVEPKGILFSQPTICDAIPATQPGIPFEGHKALHEDDWRQVEFVPAANRDYLDAKLKEFTDFREQHRSGQGFTEVFIRPEHPTTLQQAALPAKALPDLPELPLALGTSPQPGGSGREIVPGGFARYDGGDWFLYGQHTPDGMLTALGISPGHGTVPPEPFVRALVTIAGTRLLLVDWYHGAIVDTSSPEAVQAWARGFK